MAVILVSRIGWLVAKDLIPPSLPARYGPWILYAVPMAFTFVLFIVSALNRPFSLKASWYLLWLYLIFTWAINMEGHLIGDIVLILLILLVYFTLEGYELAVTDLLDKDVAQFEDKSLARAIKEITSRKSRFYDAREWIVIILAVFVTLRSDFSHLKLPLSPSATNFQNAHLVFSVLFATFSIVWISQIPPKQLAINNSQAFLTKFKFTFFWPLLKACGIAMEQLHLHSPSEMIIWCFRNSPIVSSPRRLRPSDVNYFLYGLWIYGYGYHCLRDKITIGREGGGRLVQRGVYYILSAGHREMAKSLQFDSPASLIRHETWAFNVPLIGENIADDLRITLDLVADRDEAALARRGCKKSDERVFFSPVTGKSTPTSHAFVIAYPGTLLETEELHNESATALAIGFEIEFEITPNCFPIPPRRADLVAKTHDSWDQTIGFPWRSYDLEVKLADSTVGALVNSASNDKVVVKDTENQHETQKISYPAAPSGEIRKHIKYPIIGAVYYLTWEIWPA